MRVEPYPRLDRLPNRPDRRGAGAIIQTCKSVLLPPGRLRQDLFCFERGPQAWSSGRSWGLTPRIANKMLAGRKGNAEMSFQSARGVEHETFTYSAVGDVISCRSRIRPDRWSGPEGQGSCGPAAA